VDLFEPLTPTTHTLHLEMPRDIKKHIKNQEKLEKWLKNTRQGLEDLLKDIVDSDILSIETLDYPFSFIETLVEEFNLSVCIDVGHQIKYNYDLLQTLRNINQGLLLYTCMVWLFFIKKSKITHLLINYRKNT